MHPDQCHHCGYELTGLSRAGTCPECGNAYDTQSLYRSARPSHPIARNIKPIALGLFALGIVLVGGGLSMLATNKTGFVLLTLAFASVPAFGAFVFWWSDREARKSGG